MIAGRVMARVDAEGPASHHHCHCEGVSPWQSVLFPPPCGGGAVLRTAGDADCQKVNCPKGKRGHPGVRRPWGLLTMTGVTFGCSFCLYREVHQRGILHGPIHSAFCTPHSAFITQHSALSTFHPSATSSIIISVKPNAKKMVPMLECSPSDISGISSSTTT